ncbi:unnamed protein product [Lepidochelys kempii]
MSSSLLRPRRLRGSAGWASGDVAAGAPGQGQGQGRRPGSDGVGRVPAAAAAPAPRAGESAQQSLERGCEPGRLSMPASLPAQARLTK